MTKPSRKGTVQPKTIGNAVLVRVIDEYAKTGKIRPACANVGISYRTHYRHMQSDEEYRKAFEEAEQEAAANLEDIAYSIAADDRNVDAIFRLLKRFKPDLYRDRQTSIEVTINLADRLEAARARLRAMPLELDKPDELT